MTDTLTLERTLTRVRQAAARCLPGALAYGVGDPSGSTNGIEEGTTVAPRRYSRGRIWQDPTNKLQTYVFFFQSNAMPATTYTWALKRPGGKGFEGLAAILTSLQEPARNNWGSLSLVSDEESPVPATSDMFLSHLREAFAVTCAPWELQKWAELAYQLATELMPADVEAPQKVVDPENEGECWLAIIAKCKGSLASILTAYDKLVERFVAEVPAEARDRIRFEILVDD
jgi:hypothetical protein